MKQYLHTIMRSLCIMLMLCGISTGAWAQGEYFEGSGTSTDPYIITEDNWKYLKNYSNQGYIFEIPDYLFLYEAPTEYLSGIIISYGHDAKIFVKAEYPSTLIPLIGSSLSNYYIFYEYTISTPEQWAYYAKDCTNTTLPDYKHFQIDYNDLTFTDFPELPSADYKYLKYKSTSPNITIGSQETPISFKQGMNPLIGGRSIGEKYYFSVTNENWNDFVVGYNKFNSLDAKFSLAEDIEITYEQLLLLEDPINIALSHFDYNGHTITVGKDDSYTELPTTFKHLFSSTDLENQVTYYFSVTNTNWNTFVSIYDDVPNAKFTLGEDIVLPSYITLDTNYDNLEFNDYNITVGTQENPVPFPETFVPLFSDSESEKNVEYYFSVTTEDELSNIAENYSTLTQNENVHFSLANDINLSSVPDDLTAITSDYFSLGGHCITIGKATPLVIPDEGSIAPVFTDETLQAGVKYYYSVTTDTWNDAFTFYNGLDESTKGNVYLVADSNIELEDFPEYTLSIDASNLILNNEATISVGKTTPIDFSSSDFTHVFSSDLDNSVDYYFSVTSSNWDDAVSYYNALENKDNVYLVAENAIELESLPSAPLDIAEDHFISSSSITVGSDSNHIEFSTDITHVFDGDLDDNVIYYFSVTAETWSAFVDYYNDLSAPNNVYLVMTDNIILEGDTPNTLTIDSSNFINDNNNKITVSATFNVFSSSDMNEAYVIYPVLEYNVNQDNWSTFIADYANGDISDETPVTISGTISLTSDDFPSSPISLANITFNECTIKVGSDSYDHPLQDSFSTESGSFSPIFESDENESHVTYYFSVGSDNFSNFTSMYSDLSKDNVYLKLTESVTVDDGTYISEFNGHFDGNGKYVSITIPECTLSEFKPLFAEGMTNVTNVKYNCDNISITSAEELVKLHDEYSTKWYNICTNYSINNEIDLSDQSWTRIDDTKASMTVTVNSTVTFPSCSVSNPLTIASESTYDNYLYSELTISSEDDVKSLAEDKSSLLSACLKLKLSSSLDFTTRDDITLPLSYSGAFDQNGKTITLAPLSVDDTEITGLFDGVEGVEYDVSLFITTADELSTFATEKQDNWTLCKKVIIGDSSSGDITLTDFVPTISEENFDITLGSNINIGSSDDPMSMAGYQPLFDGELNKDSKITYNLGIRSQSDIEALDGATELEGSYNYNITVYAPNEKAGAGYDYDLSSAEISTSITPTNVNKDDEGNPIIILLSDKSSTDPFSSDDIKYLYSPSYELVDVLFNNAITVEENRGKFFTDSEYSGNSDHYITAIADFAGHGTKSSPYQIYSYEMLAKLIEIVNAADEDYTSGMYIQLASDINMQGNERLTDENGNASNTTATIQFTKAFKGYFNGNNHSIGGLTLPLFSSLDGAEIKNLGIVDCNMTEAALATSAVKTGENNSTVTMSYVSGVSAGLIPSGAITATNCYAFNPQTYANRTNKTVKLATTETDGYKAYNISEGTGDGKVTLVDDLSGTHKVIKGNSYAIAGGYSDCTLFIPTSNTFYTYTPSSTLNMSSYISYINWADDFDWIESPCKSNVALLHNVLYNNFWNKNTCNDNFAGYGGVEVLSHLYSWYIADKKFLTIPSDPFRVKNIYYSRNNASTTPPAPDGLNTIYLPFAWNPATDLYYTNDNGEEEQITDATVHILADKLTESDGQYSFSNDALYKDYSMEKSLLFFQPTNEDFAGVSNALPTLLNIPEGKSGWYIKRTDLANYGAEITDNKEETINGETVTYPNLYDRYWEDPNAIDNSSYDETQQKKGRSFMEIGRLGEEWSNEDSHDSSYENYTRTIHYTCEDKSSAIYSCDTQKQIYKTDADKTVCITDNDNNSSDYSIYKANANGDIAIDGDVKILTIYQAESIINGDQRPLTIYQVDENGNNVQDENNSDICIQTSEDDQIFLDSEGYPVKIILADGNVEIELTRESDKTTGEVVSGSGTLQGNVLVEISSDYPHYFDTSSSDRIVVDNEGYPKKIILNYSSDPVEIEINRVGSSITGTVISGNYNFLKEGNKVVIDNSSFYPLSFYVCGGHEETDDCTWSGSDFPGRAYHIGTFKTIGNGNSNITFGAGTYGEYKCYKLNSAGTGFAKVTATSTVQPFRTFFAIAPGPDSGSSTGAKAYSLSFCGIYDGSDIEDTPTQIDGAPVEGIKLMTTAQSRVYSLDGRYVGQYGQKKLARGMYIMNGKKFVVK